MLSQDLQHLSDNLSAYDPQIKTRQMKIDGWNKRGYEWQSFVSSFNTYITDKERREIEVELGLVAGVAQVAPKEHAPSGIVVTSVGGHPVSW